MLRILESQMEHLGQRTRRRFLGMMERYLRESFSLWVAPLDDETLRRWLGYALDKCAGYGVTTEPEAAQLILLFLLLGVDADEREPWIAETLSSPKLAPVGKVKKLIQLARERGVARLEDAVFYEGMEA